MLPLFSVACHSNSQKSVAKKNDVFSYELCVVLCCVVLWLFSCSTPHSHHCYGVLMVRSLHVLSVQCHSRC